MADTPRATPDLNAFHAYFQPIVVLRTGRLHGFELLARWNHPVRGWLLPEAFIADAERDGWIDRLTWELLRQAFTASARLPQPLGLAVNISPMQLRNSDLPRRIQDIADESGFRLHRLTIEITESALADDLHHARAVVTDLKRRGCSLALDDFGTGYSSLSHLESLPFDTVKVDRSFTGAMAVKRSCRKIVAAVVGLGQSLGLTTVAEGVETEEQAEMLRWLGCDLAQGWLYGEPVPAGELATAVQADILASPPAERPAPGHQAEADSEGPGASGESGPRRRRSLENLPAQRLALLQAIYDGAPVGLAFLDRNLRYVSINRRLADMNGHSIEDHLGRTVREMIPELFPNVEALITRALNGESIHGVEVTKPPSGPNPGAIILLSYEPALDEAGEVIGVSVALSDITSLRQSEQACRETELHLRHLMELLPQIPWVIDPEGRALDVSQRWLDLTGMNDGQWRGFGWLDAVHPDDRPPLLDDMRRSFLSGDPIDVVYRVRRGPAAAWTPLRSRGAARIGPDGRIVCWYGSIEIVDANSPGAASD